MPKLRGMKNARILTKAREKTQRSLEYCGDPEKMRVRRFVYNANSSCGFIAFCSPSIHNWNFETNSSLASEAACDGTSALAVVCLEFTLSVCIVIGNVLILYVMNTSSNFCNPQGVFKTSLAASDFLVGAIILPSAAFNKIHVMFYPLGQNHLSYFASTENSTGSIFFGMLFSTCMSASLFSLMMLVIDRMLAVHWPFKYSQGSLMTRRRAICLVIATWCLSVLLGILPLGDTKNFSYSLDYMTLSTMLEIKPNFKRVTDPSIAHGLFFLILVFILPYVCVVAITTITWLKFVCTRATPCGFTTCKGAKIPTNHTSSTAGQPLNRDLERVTLTIFIMVVVFTICVLPFLAAQIENLAMANHEPGYMTSMSRGCDPVFYMISVELLYTNSFCNFVIYNLRNDFFKKELARKIKLHCC